MEEIKSKTNNIIYLNFEKTNDLMKASNAVELVEYVNRNRKDGKCYIFLDEVQEVDDCPSFEDPEWQADEFAAQLLVPTKYVVGDCDTKLVAEMFNVSESCVVTRKLYYERRLKRKNEKLSN